MISMKCSFYLKPLTLLHLYCQENHFNANSTEFFVLTSQIKNNLRACWWKVVFPNNPYPVMSAVFTLCSGLIIIGESPHGSLTTGDKYCRTLTEENEEKKWLFFPHRMDRRKLCIEFRSVESWQYFTSHKCTDDVTFRTLIDLYWDDLSLDSIWVKTPFLIISLRVVWVEY